MNFGAERRGDTVELVWSFLAKLVRQTRFHLCLDMWVRERYLDADHVHVLRLTGQDRVDPRRVRVPPRVRVAWSCEVLCCLAAHHARLGSGLPQTLTQTSP